jgi:hypothetical protein
MLIHRQNSYTPRGKWRTGRREAQSRGTGPHSKNILCIIDCLLAPNNPISTVTPNTSCLYHYLRTRDQVSDPYETRGSAYLYCHVPRYGKRIERNDNMHSRNSAKVKARNLCSEKSTAYPKNTKVSSGEYCEVQEE